MNIEERFLSKVEEADGHWIWTGGVSEAGYPRFWAEGRDVRAHRWAYERWVGPIPEGHDVDHVCRIRVCVRPHSHHLEAVTPLENRRRAVPFRSQVNQNAGKTACLRGHEFTPTNTRVDADGKRRCRACRAERARKRRREKDPNRG